jgi:hypothetical protein
MPDAYIPLTWYMPTIPLFMTSNSQVPCVCLSVLSIYLISFDYTSLYNSI